MKYEIFQIKADAFASQKKLDALYAAMNGKVILGLVGGYYEHVANIFANDLEEVFDIGNGYGKAQYEEDEIERIGKMTSVSVGNIVKDENGDFWACKNVGWEKL